MKKKFEKKIEKTDLRIVAQKLLDVMNDTDFDIPVCNAARSQLNKICYQMWNGGIENLEFVTWIQNDKNKYALLYTWEKNEKTEVN